jgi:hypothetical protein
MKMEPRRVIGRTNERPFVEKPSAFPITGHNYQEFPLDRFNDGGSASDDRPSFRNISREYFRYEARRNFLAEGIVFLAIIAILAATFISGALIIVHFLQLPEA